MTIVLLAAGGRAGLGAVVLRDHLAGVLPHAAGALLKKA